MKSQKIIDWERGITLAAGDEKLAEDLLRQFIASLPEHISIISSAYINNDMTLYAAEIHRLHGACCYCALPRLKASLYSLETAIRKNHDPNELTALHDEFTKASEELLSFARRFIEEKF